MKQSPSLQVAESPRRERFTIASNGDTAHVVFDDGGMNLLSSDALRELRAVFSPRRLGDSATGRLVFRSSRPNIFAAGADMAEMQRFSPRDAYEFARLGQEVFEAIERAPFLTIAQIDGDCFGGALDLVLAFDFRFATPRARFAHPGARLGIVTGFGGTSRWHRVISRPAAHQLFLANRVIGADEALRIGLVDRVDDGVVRASGAPPPTGAPEARTTPFELVKELANHADQLSRAELLLVARRLGGIYLP